MIAQKQAVVLLSGGLDSSTVLYHAKAEGYDCYALSFDYQQRHRQELQAAAAIANAAGVKAHQVVTFDLRLWGGSALTDTNLPLPSHRDPATMAANIPITYVPARNSIFLSFALAYAEAIAASDVFIGVNAVDYSGYPDCRSDYIAAMQVVFQLGTKQGREGQPIQIQTPLIHLTKPDIIRLGNHLGVPWQLTWSCYSDGQNPRIHGQDDPGQSPPVACGVCDSCQLRLAAFKELQLTDPLPYARG